MSLLGKGLQVADTMNLRFMFKTKDEAGRAIQKTLYTGETDKADFEKKFSKLEVFSGVGSNKTFQLFYKPEMSIKSNIKAFDLEFLAAKNGVELDTTKKTTFYLGQSTAVTTQTATVSQASRIMSVQRNDGMFFDIVLDTPTNDNEVQIVITEGVATLTFNTDFKDTTVNVSYEGEVPEGKENLTIVLDGKSLPKAGELLLDVPVYSEEENKVLGNFYVNLYKALLNGDYTLSFEMGKTVDIDVSFEIMPPKFLPDGTINNNKEIGTMNFREE